MGVVEIEEWRVSEMRGNRNGGEGDLSSTWTRPRETCLPDGGLRERGRVGEIEE